MSDRDDSSDFAALLAEHGGLESLRLEVGQPVRVRIIHVSQDTVFCELSASQEGYLPAGDLLDKDGKLTVQIGDVIDAFVVKLDDGIQLGMRIGRGGDVAALEAARAGGMPVEGTVTGVNKGGLEVNVAGARGFCPIGQADLEFIADPATFVGRTLKFLVRDVRENGRNVILSRRALLEREREASTKQLLAELAVGQRRHGKVTRAVGFGLFVDIGGGVEGLIPMSELGHARVATSEDVARPGDELEVEVLRIEDDPKRPGRPKIGLSLKATQPDPIDAHAETLAPGRDLPGKVVRLEPFGAFVELFPGVQGLVHVSELADRRIGHPKDVVTVGDAVTVRVLSVDREKRRVALSLKEAGRAARGSGGEPSVGEDVTGTVQSIERFGVFLSLGGGRTGLMPGAESGTPRGSDLAKAFAIGTELAVRIIGVDERGRIKVSKRARDEADERADAAAFMAPQSGKGFGTLGDLLSAKKKR